jgi:hypothetical protein
MGSKDFAVGMAQSFFWFVLILLLVFPVSEFEKVCRDFGIQPDDATYLVVLASRTARTCWFFVPLPLIVWPFVYAQVAAWLSRENRSIISAKWIWKNVTWLLPFLSLICGALAILMALMFTTTPLSGHGGHK